ncbi:MAG: Gfo/Idh/MocA family protein [Fidelibacterota bacterium]
MLKLGIISFAHLHAHSYAACLKSLENVDFIGIADENIRRGTQAAEKFGVKYFKRFSHLIQAGVNAVIITSHKQFTLEAAVNGIHVLCEKPIAATIHDALQMIQVCREKGVIFQMAFPCRFLTPVRIAKEAVDSGELGKIYAAVGTNRGKNPGGWFVKKELSGGGAVLDHTVHLVDLMRWFLGSEIKRCYARIDSSFGTGDIDDCGTIILDFENGAFGSIDPSWSRPDTFPTWGDLTVELVGENGTLMVDAFKQTVQVYDDNTKRHVETHWGDNMDFEMIHHFIDCVKNGKQPLTTAVDGLRALEVALTAYESARKGKPFDISRTEI